MAFVAAMLADRVVELEEVDVLGVQVPDQERIGVGSPAGVVGEEGRVRRRRRR